MRVSALFTTVAAFFFAVSGKYLLHRSSYEHNPNCSTCHFFYIAAAEADSTADPAVIATAAFPEANPFGRGVTDVDVVNGEKNVLLLNVENKSGRNVTLVNIAGSVSHPETGRVVKNLTATKFGVTLPEDVKIEIPYAFYSEFKPGDIRLNIWVEHSADGETHRASAYDSVVTIVEPEISIFDFKLITTYLMVLALFGGSGYLVYLNLVPQPRKKKAPSTTAPVSSETSATGYQEEWIPEHHLKKSKKATGVATSGDELSGSEISGIEGKRRKGRK
ncbi:hypothetical protein H0H92_009433 [Tricholoma furcatifolium]|nr:hypothetical protein H0H92_009433 [Tricholoma furcatifolium]